MLYAKIAGVYSTLMPAKSCNIFIIHTLRIACIMSIILTDGSNSLACVYEPLGHFHDTVQTSFSRISGFCMSRLRCSFAQADPMTTFERIKPAQDFPLGSVFRQIFQTGPIHCPFMPSVDFFSAFSFYAARAVLGQRKLTAIKSGLLPFFSAYTIRYIFLRRENTLAILKSLSILLQSSLR